jgi:hypothetical protein
MEISPLLIAIVIGIVYNVYRSFQQNKHGESNKRTITPKLDPMHPKHFERTQLDGKIEPTTIQPGIQTSELKKFDSRKKQDVVTRNVSIKKKDNFIKKSSSHTPLQKLNKQKIMEGFIYSEVLGPPRSLKPHNQSKRK